LKEERLSKISTGRAKKLKELTEAAIVLQKHWRRYRCVYFVVCVGWIIIRNIDILGRCYNFRR